MLIEEFASAMINEDLKRLKEIASVLSQFKGYSQCIDAYIDQSQAVNIWKNYYLFFLY